MDIPVYLVAGFLDAGKTNFINGILEDGFAREDKTLLLCCEEGEEEYDVSAYPHKEVYEQVLDYDELSPEMLTGLQKKYNAERVVVELNGMHLASDFYLKTPDHWKIAQEVMFADATTFLSYNANMRQLVYDKLKSCELVVFNRCTKGFDKMPFHKEVRVANRRSQILYEYGPYDVEPDDIEDPLPFDKTQSKITISDDDYAEWYRDINENEDDYEGKTLTLKGRVAMAEDLSTKGRFAFGRHVMTCCVEDIQFAGLMCIYANADDFKTGDWVEITAKVRVEYEEAYGEKGPVLYAKSVKACAPADPEVATF